MPTIFCMNLLTKRGRAIRRNRNRAKGWKIPSKLRTNPTGFICFVNQQSI